MVQHNKAIYEGSNIDAVTSQFGLHQIFKEPTHILKNSSSCIDLIFMFHQSLIIELGVNPLLHSNCQHHITYVKLNRKIHYPPPYKRKSWGYQKANTDHIRKAIKRFPWNRSFKDLEVNKIVFLFNRTVKNISKYILPNYILHESIICDNKDPPGINN